MSDFKLNVDFIYPIGSIYITTKNIDPGVLFGGTWVQTCKSRYMMGAGSNLANTDNGYGSYAVGNKNFSAGTRIGEITHTLTTNEIPSHLHNYTDSYHYANQGSGTGGDIYGINGGTTSKQFTYQTGSTGGGAAHNNMPPGQVYYIWERTA